MTPVDAWGAAAAAMAGSALAIRARMLRPHHDAWTHAPAVVWVGLSLLGMALVLRAITIARGVEAIAAEAMVYTVEAAVSAVMLWNLNRNGRRAQAERERIAREVAAAMDGSGPPKRYPFERPRA